MKYLHECLKYIFIQILFYINIELVSGNFICINRELILCNILHYKFFFHTFFFSLFSKVFFSLIYYLVFLSITGEKIKIKNIF